jgi:hypothetical protein
VAQRYASETAYYLNGKLGRVALINRGVRFPAGRWLRIAGGAVLAWHVEEIVADLFPSLGTRDIPITQLLTDFDVQEFEQALQASGLLASADADADADPD